MTCNKPLKPSSHSERGFTLIEVLVALTIMAMITAVAFAGLNIGIDSWQRGSRKIDELDTRFALERLLQRQVALADSHLFQGNNRELKFISTYSLMTGPSDPVVVSYANDSGQLIYGEMPATEMDQNRPAPLTTQPLGKFSKLDFRYLAEDAQQHHVWLDEWPAGKALPLAVRIQIADDVLTIPLVNRQ